MRVMLSSGSSSSPASEPLILSGGAGAEAAWECVHAVAWPALRGAVGDGLEKSSAFFQVPCPYMGTPEPS